MHKVYLLLRNNQQTGPYSLEELIKSGLKKDDLIWIEGKSISWAFPLEIDSLKSYVPSVNPDNISAAKEEGIKEAHYKYFRKEDISSKAPRDKKVFVSLPYGPYPPTATINDSKPASLSNQKTEEPQWGASAYSQPSKTDASNVSLQNNYSRSLIEVEESYTNWMYQQKIKSRKKIPSKAWALLSVALLLLVLGFFVGKEFFSLHEIKTKSASSQLSSANESFPAVNSPNPVSPQKQNNVAVPIANKNLVPPDNHKSMAEAKHSIKTQLPAKWNSEKGIQDQPAMATEKREQSPVAITNNDHASEATPQNNERVSAPEKKKQFGDRINDFFDKLKHRKEEDQSASSGDKESTTTNSGERKAVHRGDEAPAATENENLVDLVDVTANEPQDNWMLGIRGLKITLRNRSDETIKTAVVEVNYYSEDNKLLQTKKLQFTNIAPKKSATIAAPDHSIADHTDYHLLSVSK